MKSGKKTGGSYEPRGRRALMSREVVASMLTREAVVSLCRSSPVQANGVEPPARTMPVLSFRLFFYGTALLSATRGRKHKTRPGTGR